MKITKTDYIVSKALRKSEIRKQLIALTKYEDDYEIHITNYHFEEDGEYTNDIEVLVCVNGEYKDQIDISTFTIKDFKFDWWKTVEFFDKKSESIKQKLYDFISEEFENVEIKKGYWA